MDFPLILILMHLLAFLVISLIDVKTFKIHNFSVIFLFFIGIGTNIYLGRSGIEFLYYSLLTFFFLFIGFILFVLGVWGAGDAKLIAVSVLFVDLKDVLIMIIASLILSALFGVFYIFCKNRYSLKGILKFQIKNKIPFAPGVFLALFTIHFLY